MFNNHIATQIIKTANGWLVITPDERSTGTSPISGMLTSAFRDPGLIQSMKDLTREINDDTDPIMAEIRRNQESDNKPAKPPVSSLKDMPQTNLHVFTTIDQVCAFLKIRSGE